MYSKRKQEMIDQMESFRSAMEAEARTNGFIKDGESISFVATAGPCEQ